MLSRNETLLVESLLLLHPWVEALLMPRIDRVRPWIIPRCTPQSLQSTLPCMCVCNSHCNTRKTARSALAEVIRTRGDDLVRVRISVCVAQFPPPESAFCVSMWRRRCESWGTHRRSVALGRYLLAWISFLGVPSCSSQPIEGALGVRSRIGRRMVLLWFCLPGRRGVLLWLVLLGRRLVLLWVLLPRRAPSLVVIRFWILSFVFEGVTTLILHREEGGRRGEGMKCSVSLCQMSPRCLVFLDWNPLARRNGSTSTRGFDRLFFTQFPSP